MTTPDTPTCGHCAVPMTPENSKLMPEMFLCDTCARNTFPDRFPTTPDTPPPKSETPITDEAIERSQNLKDCTKVLVLRDCSRQLERENARLKEALRNLKDECLASDFNEHWGSYRNAAALLRV